MKLASLEEQKQFTERVRNYIKQHGDPYDNHDFQFNVDTRRHCFNWMNFLGILNRLEVRTKRKEQMRMENLLVIKDFWERNKTRYFSSN